MTMVPERPHPPGERPAHQERSRERGQHRENVVRHEAGVGVRVGDARGNAGRAVDELVLVQLVAEGHRQQVQPAEDRQVDPDAGHEHLAAPDGVEQIVATGHQQRRQHQPAEQRLRDAQERQVEQEEGDIQAEHRIGDRSGRGERHTVDPQQQRGPRTGHRARDADGDQQREAGEGPRRDRDQVGQVVGVEGHRAVIACAAAGESGTWEDAAGSARGTRAALRLALRLHPAVRHRLEAAGALRIGGRCKLPGDEEVSEQHHEGDGKGHEEQADLRAKPGPEDGVEPDGGVPDRVGPEVDDGARKQDDEGDQDNDDREADASEHRSPWRRCAVIRATHGARLARRAACSTGRSAGRVLRARVQRRRLVGIRASVVLGVILVGTGRRLVLVDGVVLRTGIRVARRAPLDLRATALQLPHELVEQVAHRVESRANRAMGPIRGGAATPPRGRIQPGPVPQAGSGASSPQGRAPI